MQSEWIKTTAVHCMLSAFIRKAERKRSRHSAPEEPRIRQMEYGFVPYQSFYQASTLSSQTRESSLFDGTDCGSTIDRSRYSPGTYKRVGSQNVHVSLTVSVSVSAQDGIVALGKAHTRSAPSLSSLQKVALQTVPIFVWLNTDRSRPLRVECRPLPFSTPLSFRRSVL